MASEQGVCFLSTSCPAAVSGALAHEPARYGAGTAAGRWLTCFSCLGTGAENFGEDNDFEDDEVEMQYADGTAQQILDATVMSIECQHCKLRLGITGAVLGQMQTYLIAPL